MDLYQSRGAYTPAVPHTLVSNLDCPNADDADTAAFMRDKQFRSRLGELLWIARNCRPDLSHPVNALARVAHNPGREHWHALQHLARYLDSTRDRALTFYRPDHHVLKLPALDVHTDADYAPRYGSKYDNYRSTSGFASFAEGSLLSWRSRRQSLLATSSTESEYYAASVAAKEAAHLRGLLTSVTGGCDRPVLHVDNKSTLSVASDAANQFASKHFDVRAHYLREQARDGALELVHVPTNLNWADGMTKSLAAPAFTAFANALGVHDRLASRSRSS